MDSKFNRIVAAYDGSADSAKAVRTAASLSMEFGANLTVLHVFSLPAMAYAGAAGNPVPNYRELEDSMRDGAKVALAKGLQIAREAGAKPKGELLESASTVQALVEFSKANKVDLIVIGTRGMTGFKRLVLGSVSSGVVTHATCSVLVVR